MRRLEGSRWRLRRPSICVARATTLFPVDSREIHGTTPWTVIELPWTASPGIRRVQVCVRRDPSDNPDVPQDLRQCLGR